MSPDAFAANMNDIIQRGTTPYSTKVLAQDLMCDVLGSLGYDDGVRIFKGAEL